MSLELDGLRAFRTRARVEAERYGDDPWVFVRELIQNARDADATMLTLTTVENVDGSDRLIARDDGCGMSLAEARRFLFTLYASSKRGRRRTAGRFGVGFWSVLRFEPAAVTVRSRPAGEQGWEVRLAGEQARVTDRGDELPVGTEIVLERATGPDSVADAVRRAVVTMAAFVRRRDRPELPFEVWLNGARITADEPVAAPLLRFEARGVRGVVGFAPEPRVELCVHGFRVRTAAVLADLRPPVASSDPPMLPLPEGLAPRFVLDSDRLGLLMSRAEPRVGRELGRVLRIAERQLGRLLRRELDRVAPGSPRQRLMERLRASGWSVWRWRLAAGLLVVAVAAGVTVAPSLRSGGDDDAPREPGQGVGRTSPVEALRGLEGRYRGPSVDRVAAVGAAPDIDYSPPDLEVLLACLRIRQLDALGRVAIPAVLPDVATGRPCATACLELRVRHASTGSWLRLPMPTGYVLDPASVRLGGRPAPVRLSAAGEPVLMASQGSEVVVELRAAQGPDPNPVGAAAWPELPPAWRRLPASWRGLASAQAAEAAVALVREHVRYDRGPEVAARYAAAIASGMPLIERALAVGAGDCDVQNTLVAALLEASGVPARLALGWRGSGGRAEPGLHAWVELRDESGQWQVADASVRAAPPPHRVLPVPPMAVTDAAAAPHAAADTRWRLLLLLGATAGLVAVGVALIRQRAAVVGTHVTGDGIDLDELVAGLATRPAEWSGAATAVRRPLLETLAGGRMSLARARRLASAGRLYLASTPHPRLAPAACTLAAGQRRCRVVAEALGAPDLDHWHAILGEARADAVLELVATTFERCGLRVALRLTSAADAAELAVLRTSRTPPLAVLATTGESWREIAALARASASLAAAAAAGVVIPALIDDPLERDAMVTATTRLLLGTAGGAP